MAGMYMEVWTYDEDTQSIWSMGKLNESCEFYRNGIIKNNISHNHTFGSLWPYSLGRYDSDNQEFIWFASAYSLDRELDSSNQYSPADDADGDGIIYYFYNDNEQPSSLTFAQYQEQVQEIIPDNQKMSMAWKTMEWCNISKVGNGEG